MENFISVVIPTYSRPGMLGKAIDSVLEQEYEDYEVLVIDDNGIGNVNQINTENFMKKYKDNHKVRYITHKTNLGGNAARNTGIQNARGSFIGFLDDDDEWLPNFLKIMMKSFINNNVGAVYCNYYMNKNGNTFYSKRDSSPLYEGEVFKKLLEGWCPASTSLFIIRKECFERVGFFDVKLKSFQDYDMWLRIAQQYLFKYVNERLVIKYEEHGGEQVGFNPYNRRIAWIGLKEKWDSQLNDNEKKLFKVFLEIHDRQIKRNLIVYNKQNHIKSNFFQLYKDYWFTNARKQEKIILLLVCVIGLRVFKYKDILNFMILRRYKVVG